MSVENIIQPVEVAEHDARLVDHLANHDVRCPMCEYNLRDLRSAVCPECGEALQLRVSLSEPKIAAYLCGLIGLSLGIGFSGLWFGFVLVGHLVFGSGVSRPPFWVLAVLGTQFVTGVMLMWVWLVQRKWIRRRSRDQRWTLVILMWGWTFGLTALFFMITFNLL